MSVAPHVVVLGGEPAALACAARLLLDGVRVTHLSPNPWGWLGASREIGVAYPENGEPLERLEYAIGEEAAHEFHRWGREGIDLLVSHAEGWDGFRRGSRLGLTRTEGESGLVASDALYRSRTRGDDVRLMSGAAGSNYAPLSTEVHQAVFETHTAAFAPAGLCEQLSQRLQSYEQYRSIELTAESGWEQLSVQTSQSGVSVGKGGEVLAEADLMVVAGGLESARILGKFESSLVPLLGQAFLSAPLRETTRASVVGLTASWGHERYRFDPDRRLLGCGINPGAGERYDSAIAIPEAQDGFYRRALQLFADLAEAGEPEARWGVLFTATCDGLPLLGPLQGEPRIHIATGFSTSAWSRGYAAGEQVARCLSGAPGSALMQRCSPRRFGSGPK